METIFRIFGLGLLLCGPVILEGETRPSTEPVYIFEGTIGTVDTPLNELVRAGDVLAGSLQFTAPPHRDFAPNEASLGEFQQVVQQVELTLDRHYLQTAQAGLDSQRISTARTHAAQDRPTAPAQFNLTLPVTGSFERASRTRSRIEWLEFFFYDSAGRFLPGGGWPDFQQNATTVLFRLACLNESQDGYAFLTGKIVRFVVATDQPVSPEQDVARLESTIRELQSVIEKQDGELADLRSQLEEARSRAAYLAIQLEDWRLLAASLSASQSAAPPPVVPRSAPAKTTVGGFIAQPDAAAVSETIQRDEETPAPPAFDQAQSWEWEVQAAQLRRENERLRQEIMARTTVTKVVPAMADQTAVQPMAQADPTAVFSRASPPSPKPDGPRRFGPRR